MSVSGVLLYLISVLCMWSGNLCIVCHPIADGGYDFPSCTVVSGGADRAMANSIGDLTITVDPWEEAMTFRVDFPKENNASCADCARLADEGSSCDGLSTNATSSVAPFPGKFNFLVAVFRKNSHRPCYSHNDRVEQRVIGTGRAGQVSIPLQRLVYCNDKSACTDDLEIFTLFVLQSTAGDDVVFATASENNNNNNASRVQCDPECPLLGNVDCLLVSDYGVVNYRRKDDAAKPAAGLPGCTCASPKECVAVHGDRGLPVVCGTATPWTEMTYVPPGVELAYLPYSILRRMLLERYHVAMLNYANTNGSCVEDRAAVQLALQSARLHLEDSCFNVRDYPESVPLLPLQTRLARTISLLEKTGAGRGSSCRPCNVSDALMSRSAATHKNQVPTRSTSARFAAFLFRGLESRLPSLRLGFLLPLLCLVTALAVSVVVSALLLRCLWKNNSACNPCTCMRRRPLGPARV